MRQKICLAIPLLLLFSVVARTEAPKCVEDTSVQLIPYCDLVRDPSKFDGHVVRTDAVWQRMIHSGALADRSCPSSNSEPLLTLPSFAEKSNFESSQRKALWKLLGKGGAARVRVMGIFHGPKGRPYAADGQSFQLEIKCLLAVTPLRPEDK